MAALLPDDTDLLADLPDGDEPHADLDRLLMVESYTDLHLVVGSGGRVNERAEPRFGEVAVSWQTVWYCLCPEEVDPHDDAEAAGMHRLRGLVMAQCAETEAVLGMIVARLDPSVDVERRTAGRLLRDIRRLLGRSGTAWAPDVRVIDEAIRRRNHAVHSPVTIGSVWEPGGIGGGGWIPVISLMKGDEYDEADLRRDLVLQHEATTAAVRLLRAVSVGGADLGATSWGPALG